MILTLLGCVPVLGIAANAYNAYLYFEEGDILNGILSVAGAVVGVGGLMSTIGMAAKACTLIQAGQYVKAAGLAYTTAAMAYMTVDNAYQTYNLLVENDFTFTEEVQLSIGNTFLAGIGTVAGFKGFINCMNETAAMIQKAEASCFVAGTQVLIDEGFKNIEDIQPGDYVYSTSDETGESGYKEVLEVFVKETEVITHVFYEIQEEDGEIGTEEIETTLNHRFWSEGEWKAAGTLKAGDLLTLADGTQVEVTDVTFEDRHETVYNMEVADYHTYYVGEDGVWVHNRYGQEGKSGGTLRDSRNIRYSQDSINGTFNDGTNVNDLTHHLQGSPDYALEVEPIRIVKYNDLPQDVQSYLSKQGVSSSTVFSLDNRRLYAAKQAGVKVNSVWATQADLNDIDLVKRFSTVTGGKTIEIR